MELLQNALDLKRLNNVELLTEMSMLAFLGDMEGGKVTMQFISGAKVLSELYQRFGENERILDALRADAIRKIVLFCQQNPKASEDAQAKEIKKQIDDFSMKVALVIG